MHDSCILLKYIVKSRLCILSEKSACPLRFFTKCQLLNIAMLDSYQVTFSSLDVHLHTEALLNTMNFLNNLLPPTTKKEGGQEELPTIPEEDETEKEEEKMMETVVTKKKSWFSF